jgi:hypothetical protein
MIHGFSTIKVVLISILLASSRLPILAKPRIGSLNSVQMVSGMLIHRSSMRVDSSRISLTTMRRQWLPFGGLSTNGLPPRQWQFKSLNRPPNLSLEPGAGTPRALRRSSFVRSAARSRL